MAHLKINIVFKKLRFSSNISSVSLTVTFPNFEKTDDIFLLELAFPRYCKRFEWWKTDVSQSEFSNQKSKATCKSLKLSNKKYLLT